MKRLRYSLVAVNWFAFLAQAYLAIWTSIPHMEDSAWLTFFVAMVFTFVLLAPDM